MDTNRRLRRGIISGIIALLLSGAAFPVTALSSWAESWGADSPYRPPVYLSGFGTADDMRETARRRALGELTEKVRVQVQTDLVTRTTDTGNTSRTSVQDAVHITSAMDLGQVHYETEERRGEFFVLAWTEIGTLKTIQEENGRTLGGRFSTALQRADRAIAGGDLAAARVALDEVRVTLDQIREAELVWNSLHRISARPPDREGFTRGAGIGPVVDLESDLQSREGRIETFVPESLDAAIRYLAAQTGAAGVDVVNVRPLIYRDSDFSSAFGSRFSTRLLSATANDAAGAGGAARPPAVVSGSYWPDGETVTINLRARDTATGRTVAAPEVTIPASFIPPGDLLPPNADDAFESGGALLADSVTGGGIAVEVWTNKGRSEEVLVFEAGEVVQFSFRVDQPAYLRMTYTIASGDNVLLEPACFIGPNQVNRIVNLPYEFDVVPPVGVERLVVTASSEPPETANTVPRIIDGQVYEVFSSTGEIVARTRGLARRRQEGESDTRVGEAILTLTTVARERL